MICGKHGRPGGGGRGLPRSLAQQAGPAVVGQPSCGLQVHIPADVQVCRQPPTKHSNVEPAEACVCLLNSIASPEPGRGKGMCVLPSSEVVIYHNTGTILDSLCTEDSVAKVKRPVSQSQGTHPPNSGYTSAKFMLVFS